MPTQAHYHIHKSTNGQYYFHLLASTGDILLTSETYTSRTACLNGIASVKVHAPDEQNYQRLTQTDSNVYYNLLAANYQVIGTRRNIAHANERERLIRLCKAEAPHAQISE